MTWDFVVGLVIGILGTIIIEYIVLPILKGKPDTKPKKERKKKEAPEEEKTKEPEVPEIKE